MSTATVSAGEIPYVGDELELFSHALNWKAYLRKQIAPFLGKRVLEVGAGIGATTRMLCDGSQDHWRLLEPDAPMARLLNSQVLNGELPACCEAQAGTIADVQEQFDSLIYIDVLEHIPEDKSEIAAAAEKVKDGGYIVVLSPAHQHLYTPFDERIGHCRRYSKGMLAALTPPNLTIASLRYLDSVGYFASLANRVMLKQSMPTLNQIRTWDGLMVPVSRILDPVFDYGAGKSVLCVWQKRCPEAIAGIEANLRKSAWRRGIGLAVMVLMCAVIGLMFAPALGRLRFVRRLIGRPSLLQPVAITLGALVGVLLFEVREAIRRRGSRQSPRTASGGSNVNDTSPTENAQ